MSMHDIYLTAFISYVCNANIELKIECKINSVASMNTLLSEITLNVSLVLCVDS